MFKIIEQLSKLLINHKLKKKRCENVYYWLYILWADFFWNSHILDVTNQNFTRIVIVLFLFFFIQCAGFLSQNMSLSSSYTLHCKWLLIAPHHGKQTHQLLKTITESLQWLIPYPFHIGKMGRTGEIGGIHV